MVCAIRLWFHWAVLHHRNLEDFSKFNSFGFSLKFFLIGAAFRFAIQKYPKNLEKSHSICCASQKRKKPLIAVQIRWICYFVIVVVVVVSVVVIHFHICLFTINNNKYPKCSIVMWSPLVYVFAFCGFFGCWFGFVLFFRFSFFFLCFSS